MLPDETLGRLEPVTSSVGITRVANITGLDRIGIPVVSVCRPNSRSLAVYQGKGTTLSAAKVSGIMESIERFHAEFAPPPDVKAAYLDMQDREELIDVRSLPRRRGAVFQPRLERGWSKGIDLISFRSIWVPYETVQYATAFASTTDAA